MIKTIGIELKGTWKRNDELTTYYMTDEELEQLKQGNIAVVGTVQYCDGPKGSYKYHENTIINMNCVDHISIYYDVEDDYMMHQTFYLNNGEEVFGLSRDHNEVDLWKKNGIRVID